MKLLIDIPDVMYEDIKSGKDGYSNYVHTAIRNGVPIPDCALANADAIIEELRSMRNDYEYGDDYDNGKYNGFDESIDTVHNYII